MHSPPWRYGAWDGQLVQLADVAPSHVAHPGSQDWQTESASAYMPSPQVLTHSPPFLYGELDAHEMQSVLAAPEQSPQVLAHCWHLPLLSS